MFLLHMLPWHCHHTWITTDTLAAITSCFWTLLFHVLYYCYTVIVLTRISTNVTRHGDTIIACRYLLYWTLLLYVLVNLLHIFCITPDIIISFVSHCYIDSLVCMRWLSLYSCCMEHCSCYMNYCYMDIPVFLSHICFLLLMWIW